MSFQHPAFPPPPEPNITFARQRIEASHRLEAYVLNLAMRTKDIPPGFIQYIPPTSFIDPVHRVIWKAIQYLDQQFKPIDILTVKNRLNEMDSLVYCGGVYYLIELNAIASQITEEDRITFALWAMIGKNQ